MEHGPDGGWQCPNVWECGSRGDTYEGETYYIEGVGWVCRDCYEDHDPDAQGG